MWSAQAYVETLDEFNEAFEEAGVPAGRLMARGAEGMTAFLQDVPTLHCHYELGRLKEQADNKPWSVNDLRDIEALSSAIVYADVVVAERTWTALAGRTGLPAAHNTLVVSDVRDLTEMLIRT